MTTMNDAMTTMNDAVRGWSEWSNDRRQEWSERIIVRTVRDILADIPGLALAVAQQCRGVTTITEASRAVRAAEESLWAVGEAAVKAARDAWEATEMVTEAAAVTRLATAVGERERLSWAAEQAVARAARAAARAATVTPAAADAVLRHACRIWVEEALATDESSGA